MSDSSQKANYLADLGGQMIDQGYSIIPIKRGEKFPPHDKWQETKASRSWLKKILSEGLSFTKNGEQHTVDVSRDGIGILTRLTPAIDIDISDEKIAKQVEDYCHFEFGMAPVRVGRAPRRLLLYRNEGEPFNKQNGSVYLDEWGEPQKVEVLANGQQFVAYAIHPDTKKPYHWLYGSSPLTVEADSLPTLSIEQAQAVLEYAEGLMKAAGWRLKKSNGARSSLVVVDEDDIFSRDESRVEDLTEDEIRDYVMRIPDNEDHDTWFQVGMCLYHQFNGSDEGLALWHEWSEGALNYDRNALDKRWPSFDVEGKDHPALTFRAIIKWAKKAQKEAHVEEVKSLKVQFEEVETIEQFEAACKSVKKTEMSPFDREGFADIVKSTAKRALDRTITKPSAMKLIKFENPKFGSGAGPAWMEGWVYLTTDDEFLHIPSQRTMSHSAFNSAHDRFMLTKQERMEGKATPEKHADAFALNVVEIPSCIGRMYVPGAEDLFTMDDGESGLYANRYTAKSVPKVPEKYTAADRRAIKLVEAHFEHMIASIRDREIFKDWLAYIVKTNTRPNWAVFLQGTESDGKSFFGNMMQGVLGRENVGFVDPLSLEGQFNGYAEGVQLNVIEEVKMHGHNRYDVLNRVKPLITNTTIPINRKGKESYQALNTVAYLLLSNYRDAIPLEKGATRYFVIFSRFQDPQALDKFKEENPTYYTDLFDAIENHPGALRKWLLDRKYSEPFAKGSRAPQSSYRSYMVDISRSDEQRAVEEIFDESWSVRVSRTLCDTAALFEEIGEAGVVVPQTQGLAKILSNIGMTKLGRFRIGDGETKHTFWSIKPELFYFEGTADVDKNRVLSYLNPSDDTGL